MTEAGLVLEGGATRGVFTSGALDYLMEKDLYFSYVVGVSAGSCNAVDYVSKQIGRTRGCMIHRGKEYSYYYGLKDFVKERSLLDMDMIFNKYPNELFPFSEDLYRLFMVFAAFFIVAKRNTFITDYGKISGGGRKILQKV
mgnify:CR=1 FL=1